jgi:hypothetical protein
MVTVRPLVFSDNSDGDGRVMLAGCVSGNDEWILNFAYSFHISVTNTGSVFMSFCRVEMFCVWKINTHRISWALAPFGSGCMMT